MSTQPIPTPFDAPLPGEPGGQPVQAKAQIATPFDNPLPREVPAGPPPSAQDQASQTRQMLVSGLTGMPTPNMTPQDVESFNRGKAAGAVSVPVVAGATVGAEAPGLFGALGKAVLNNAWKVYLGAEGAREIKKLWDEATK